MADFLIKDTLLNGYNYEIFRPELKIMNKEFNFLQISQLLLKIMRNSYFSPQVLIQNRFCCFTVAAHIFITDNYSLVIFYLIADGMYFDNIHIVIQTGLRYLVKLSQNIPEGYFLRNTNISVLFIKCY